MASFPFRPDRKLIDFLNAKRFTRSAEIIPPRNGSEQAKVLTQISRLVDAGAQFLAVTKGAGGSLRGGSLPIAQAIKEGYTVPAIAHFTCRDLTAAEVENQLMDHHYFGIRNILALRGDPPDGQPDWTARPGGYDFAHQLIRQIAALNRGEFLSRPGGPAPEGTRGSGSADATDFCIGAAAYPEFPDPLKRIEYFKLKVEAGAVYGITDMLFSADIYARFLEHCQKAGITVPILPGTRLLKSQSQARKMAAKFRVSIPEDLLKRLPEETCAESQAISQELFLEFVERLKKAGAPGIHLFVISDTEAAVSALHALRD